MMRPDAKWGVSQCQSARAGGRRGLGQGWRERVYRRILDLDHDHDHGSARLDHLDDR